MISRRCGVPVLLALLACSDSPPTTSLATAAVDTLPGGVVVVTNHGPALWQDTNGWQLVPDGEIAPVEGSPGALGEPIGLVLGEDDRVYVVQQKPTTIKVYGPDGRFERDISRDGEGPGEFRVGYLAVRGDTLALQDPALSRFTTFLTDGTLLGSIPSPGNWATSYIDRDAAGVVAVPGTVSDPGGNYQPVMVRTRFDLTTGDTIQLPGGPKPAAWWQASWTARGRHWNMRIPAPLQPVLAMRYTADGLLVYGTTDQTELIYSRTGHDTVRIVSTTVAPVAITPAVGDSLFQSQLDAMEWQAEWLVQGGRADVPAFWPPWLRLTVDDSGRTWLGIPDESGGVGAAQVFDQNGLLLGTVSVPDPAIFSGSWHGNRIAILVEAASGEPMIRFYRLDQSLPR